MSLLRAVRTASLALVLAAGAAAVRAEPVERTADGLRLGGELVRAGDLKDGVVLLVHGTLAHHRMELMQALQAALKERGLSSLAVTLSLGLDARTGMYDCAQPHRHRHTDAVAEIAGWVEWLKGQGAGPVTLLGHSRGGNQTARYLAGTPDAAVVRAVLLTPATGEPPDNREAVLAPAAGKPDDASVEVPALLYCGPGMATAGAVRSYYADDPRHDTLSLVGGIRVPLLLIGASNDTVTPKLVPRLAEVRGKPGVRTVVIDGADHFFRDLAAEDAVDAVAAFVKEAR
ncbi:MAG TPA: alpha/beta fold hydrolase [Azospirillum sp.]|nr:alpha/beta fold hydrolase [Azospirillum sp.]